MTFMGNTPHGLLWELHTLTGEMLQVEDDPETLLLNRFLAQVCFVEI